jgi:hypothetical protein
MSTIFEARTYTYCRTCRTRLAAVTETARVSWYRKHCLVCDRDTKPHRVQVVLLTSNIETLNREQRKAMANRLSTVSKQRLRERIGKLSSERAIFLQLGL